MGASSDAPIHDQDVTCADTGIDAATRCGDYASPLHLPQGTVNMLDDMADGTPDQGPHHATDQDPRQGRYGLHQTFHAAGAVQGHQLDRYGLHQTFHAAGAVQEAIKAIAAIAAIAAGAAREVATKLSKCRHHVAHLSRLSNSRNLPFPKSCPISATSTRTTNTGRSTGADPTSNHRSTVLKWTS